MFVFLHRQHIIHNTNVCSCYGGGRVNRPTATLRRLLVLESLQDYIAPGFSINMGALDEAIFMRKMLDAESKNRAKRMGIIL